MEISHSDIEYNPCVRKGKKKIHHKKAKKYIAKSQRFNLIKTKQHKLSINTESIQSFNELDYENLIEILKSCDISQWSYKYEVMYNELFKEKNINTYDNYYQNMMWILASEENHKNRDCACYQWEEMQNCEYHRWLYPDQD